MSVAEKKKEGSLLHFSGFTLDLQRRGLYRGRQRLHLTSKPLETLIFLAEHGGQTIEKQDLLDAVWKDTFVTEDTLVHAIREIRRALGDDKENPRFVQTVPRRGYRFVGEIAVSHVASVSPQIVPEPVDLPVSPAKPKRVILLGFWIAAAVLIMMGVLIWAFWPHGGTSKVLRPTKEPRVGGIYQKLTSGEFYSGKPAFSPDGKFILYTSSSEETRGHGDLFIRQFPGGTPLRITNKMDPSGDLPVFTADGSHVVFSVPRLDQAGVRNHDLWQVPSFGGPPVRLIDSASGAGFSPDGRWIAYTKHLSSGNALWFSPVRALEVHLEVSAEGYTPRWSPNGEWLAYTTSDPNNTVGDIWLCRVSESDGGQLGLSNQRQITNEKQQIYGLTWAADSRSIIFASKRGGSMQLYRVSIADGSISPVLTGVGEYAAPSASPESNMIVFQQYRLVNDLMMTTLGEQNEAKEITYGEFQRWPRVSPSGRKVVGVLRQVDDTEHLYLTDPETKSGSPLSDRDARHPCWLDEENVAFLSPDPLSQSTDILVVNTTTRETRSLTHFSGEANWLAVHPDGKRVAVVMVTTGGKESILLRDLSSLTDMIIQEGAEYEHLRWAPDGTALCWNRPGASRNAPLVSGGIWMIRIGQPEPRLLARSGYCPVWSKDGTVVYFTVLTEEQRGLWQYDLQQNKERKVYRWGQVFNFDIVGSRLVFAQHKNDSQIYSISLDQ